MLRDCKVKAFSSWEKELSKFCFDKRFKLLPQEERREVFASFVRNRAHEERQEKKEHKRALRELLGTPPMQDRLRGIVAEGKGQNLSPGAFAESIAGTTPGGELLGELLEKLPAKEQEGVFRQALSAARKQAAAVREAEGAAAAGRRRDREGREAGD